MPGFLRYVTEFAKTQHVASHAQLYLDVISGHGISYTWWLHIESLIRFISPRQNMVWTKSSREIYNFIITKYVLFKTETILGILIILVYLVRLRTFKQHQIVRTLV